MFINSIVKTNAPLPEQDAYLRKIPAISGLSRLDLNCPVTFLVGENGSGKSTLLEAVAVAFGFNPEGGSRNFHFSTEDTHSALSQLLCLYKGPYRPKDGFFLRAESFYNAASEVDRLSKNNLYGSSPMEKVSWPWCSTAFGEMASIFWMNRRPRSPLPGS